MQVFSTFEYSSYIELAVSELEKKGIKKEGIFIVLLIIEQKIAGFLIAFIEQMEFLLLI
jgi:hypothetical protein